MCIDFIVSLPTTVPIISVLLTVQLPKKRKNKEHYFQMQKNIIVPANIWIKYIALQPFFPVRFATLANLNDTVSFHTTNVSFINQQTF